MTPFAQWSESRFEMRDIPQPARLNSIAADSEIQLQVELSALIEDMIENLMSSSVTQLRKVFGMMEQSREEKRQRIQNDFLLRELSKIEEKTSAIVAEALVPILTDLQRSRMVNEFASILKKILPEFADQMLTIKAPVEVHERISHALKLQSIEAEVQTSHKTEIVVAGNNVVLRADLDQWVQRLSEVAAV